MADQLPPYHSTSTTRRKSQVKFISSEKSLFFPTLKKNVDDYFERTGRHKYGNYQLVVKTIVFMAAYMAPFAIMIMFNPGWVVNLLLWTVMGLAMAGLGMSVMHDANHGAYSANPALNWLMAHVLNIMGGSTGNWKLQHNILHHTYTNITDLDDDIAPKPALRLSPHQPVTRVHRYQWWHAFLLYGLTTLYWATAKDFIQFVRYRRQKVSKASPVESRKILARLVIGKLVYFFVFLVVPTVIFQVPFMKVLTGFLLMHFLAGLILTVIFQLAHSLEGTSHPLPDSHGIIDNDWAIHQMNTTMNFAPGNKILSWYVGGLNFQVEHHLFPRIAHVHYPALAPIVKATAEAFNIPYLSHTSFTAALQAHIRFLKTLSKPPDWKEAIG